MSKRTSRKRSEPVERRYTKEFAYGRFPNAIHIAFEVPVTPLDPAFKRRFPTVSERAFTRFRRYCDAVIVTDEEILLCECKIRRPIDGLGQLLLYRHYAPTVKEIKRWFPRRVVPVLVTPKDDPYLRDVCAANGFRLVIFQTEHSLGYLAEKGFVEK